MLEQIVNFRNIKMTYDLRDSQIIVDGPCYLIIWIIQTVILSHCKLFLLRNSHNLSKITSIFTFNKKKFKYLKLFSDITGQDKLNDY